MRNFDIIKSKNIDELAEWLDMYGMQDFSPWIDWFDENYCSKCETVSGEYGTKYSWCEINDDRCRFFQNMDEVPHGKELVKIWLENEDDDV